MSKIEFQVITATSEIQLKTINSTKRIEGSGIVIMKGAHLKQFTCLQCVATCNSVGI